MKLTQVQLDAFDRDGYLFFPALFRPEEIKVLSEEVPALYAQRRPENVREKTGDVVRANFAAHLYSAPFARLARHPRMVEPVPQVFGGDLWQWHLSLCAVSNHIRRFKRPDYIAHRDFTPIECLPDDCLLKSYDVTLPWKDRFFEPIRETT